MAGIDDNRFYKINNDPSLTSQEKSALVARELSLTGAAATAANAEFREYKQHLKSERQRIAREIQQTTLTLSDLKGVFDTMAKGVKDFDKNMQPLTQIIDEIAGLRLNANAGPALTEQPAPEPQLSFDGVLDHTMTVRRQPLRITRLGASFIIA